MPRVSLPLPLERVPLSPIAPMRPCGRHRQHSHSRKQVLGQRELRLMPRVSLLLPPERSPPHPTDPRKRSETHKLHSRYQPLVLPLRVLLLGLALRARLRLVLLLPAPCTHEQSLLRRTGEKPSCPRAHRHWVHVHTRGSGRRQGRWRHPPSLRDLPPSHDQPPHLPSDEWRRYVWSKRH